MMNGHVVKRGDAYLARPKAKSAYCDDNGVNWTEELQAARIYKDFFRACKAAYRVGGVVRTMKDGKIKE